MTTVSDIAKAGENIVDGVIDHEDLINTIAGAVGVLPEVLLAEKALPAVVAVLKFLEAGGASPLLAFQAFINHITPGKPNAPALSTQA